MFSHCASSKPTVTVDGTRVARHIWFSFQHIRVQDNPAISISSIHAPKILSDIIYIAQIAPRWAGECDGCSYVYDTSSPRANLRVMFFDVYCTYNSHQKHTSGDYRWPSWAPTYSITSTISIKKKKKRLWMFYVKKFQKVVLKKRCAFVGNRCPSVTLTSRGWRASL